MSEAIGRNKRKKTNDEKEMTDVDDQGHQDITEERKKLLSDITTLKQLITQTENSMNTIHFGNVCKTLISDISETSKGQVNELVDVDRALQYELYKYTGLCCKKMDTEFIFTFESNDNGLCGNKNWIKLFKIEESWHLGQWVMPLAIDIKVIFDKYTINSAMSMKLFLRECKHRIDCYHRREQQFRELQNFLQNTEGVSCSVESNYGYTQMIIKLIKARCISPNEARIILVYLGYKDNETMPCKLIIDCDGENKLSDDETKSLNAIFKNVKNLKDPVEKLLTSDGSPFIRKQVSVDDSMIDTNESAEEDGFLKILQKNPKRAKERGKVAIQTDENENEVNDDDDIRESDLSIDAIDRSNVKSSIKEASQVDIPKLGKKGSKRAKKSPKKISLKKTKVNSKAKKGSPLKHRNDKVANTVDAAQSDGKRKSFKNDKVVKSIVPEISKPGTSKSKEVLDANNEVNISLSKHGERIDKMRNRGKKTSLNGSNSLATSTRRSNRQLMCSTPIAGRSTLLSKVAEENISAIGRENTMISKKIVSAKKNEDADARKYLDDFDATESDGNEVTDVKNSQKELLKDLQAVKYKAIVTKQPIKRKAKSPARERNKISRK